MRAAVVLIDPKVPVNVGNALRAASNFGCTHLWWTPERVPDPRHWPAGYRLPREERMRLYRDVDIATCARTEVVDRIAALGYTPVAVEARAASEQLPDF